MKNKSEIFVKYISELIYEFCYGEVYKIYPGQKNLTFISTKKHISNDSIIQTNEITVCREECIRGYAETLERFNYKSDYVNIVYTSIPSISTNKTGITTDIIKRHKIDISKNIKLSKMLLNIIEDEIGWKKSTFVKFVPTIEPKEIHTRSANKKYIPLIKELPYFSFNSSKKWFISPQTLSLYLLIIRIGFSGYTFFKNVKDIKSLYKACDDFSNFSIGSGVNDPQFVNESYRYWIKFLSNTRSIYRGLKKDELFLLGDELLYGIQSLVFDDIADGLQYGHESVLNTAQKRFNKLVRDIANENDTNF